MKGPIPWKKQSTKTHAKIDILNRPIAIIETELKIKIFLKQDATGPDWFTGEYYQTFK